MGNPYSWVQYPWEIRTPKYRIRGKSVLLEYKSTDFWGVQVQIQNFVLLKYSCRSLIEIYEIHKKRVKLTLMNQMYSNSQHRH